MGTLHPWSRQEGNSLISVFVFLHFIYLFIIFICTVTTEKCRHKADTNVHTHTSTNGNKGTQKLFTKVQKEQHHTYTCTHALSDSLYVNKVPLDLLCSPSCFHPFAPRVLYRLQAQTQTHTGMIKSSNSV